MYTFSVNFKYIFNSTVSLNLILVIVMLSFMSTPVPTFVPIPNTAPLPPTINKDYNASQAVISFLVIVKPAFTKYLKET
jgi:hypothetical protein